MPFVKKTRKAPAAKTVAKKIIKLAKAKPTLGQQVKALKKTVNKLRPEILEYEKPTYGATVAQAYGGALFTTSGHYAAELPVSAPHDGQQITIMSTNINMQLFNQTQTSHSIRFRVEVWKLVGGLTVASQVVQAMYLPNTFIKGGNTSSPEVYDMNSFLNPERVRSAVKIYSKRYRMPQEGFASATETKTINFTIRYKNGHKVIYDATNNPQKGQLALVILADSGNAASAALPAGGNLFFSSTLPLSGLNLNYTMRHNYVDA